MREVDPGLGGDRGGTGGALLGASVPAVEGDMFGCEVSHRVGQQVLAGGEQGRLVGLHGQHVVRAAFLDQVRRGGPLGMQSVGGDHHPGQVQTGQQRREFGNLVGLGRDFTLREYHPGVVRSLKILGIT